MILLVIFKHTESICLSHESVLSIITPSNFWDSTYWICSLSIMMLIGSVRDVWYLVPIVITEVLVKWINILLLRHHVQKPTTPFWSLYSTTIVSLLAACTVESSAYTSAYASLIKRGISLMKIRNKTGPNIEPCGTPDFTSCIEECIFFSTIHCFLSERYDCIHFSELLSNLWERSFLSRISWPTTSNAFRISKNTAPIILPLSTLFSHLSKRLIRAVLQEWFFRKPDWDLCNMLYLFK